MRFAFLIYGLLSTFYFFKFVIPLLNKGLVDIPNKRSLHVNPTPTGGGIVFPLQTIIIALFLGEYLSLLCLPLSIVGFIDDKYNLSSKTRFLFQVFTSIFIVHLSPFSISGLPINYVCKLLIYLFIIFVFSAFINFINFMDGIDGLVGSCILVGLFFIGIENDPLIFILIGSLIGFLKWNWSPSKIFMGDVGSTFLASYYLLSLTRLNNINNIIGFFLILSPLIFDALFCVLRRFLNGQNIFKAHKLHLYQRLCESGMTHSKVTILYSLACLILAITYNIFGIYPLIAMVISLISFGIWLDQKIAISFKN